MQVAGFATLKEAGLPFHYILCLPKSPYRYVLYWSHLNGFRSITSSHSQYVKVDPQLHVDMLMPFLDKLVLLGIVLHTLPLE